MPPHSAAIRSIIVRTSPSWETSVRMTNTRTPCPRSSVWADSAAATFRE